MKLMLLIKSVSRVDKLTVFLLWVLFSALFFASSVGGMNSGDGAHYALIQSLADDRTVIIDKHARWTYFTDYVLRDGHYYSDRDPGLSYFSLPFYFAAKLIAPIASKPYPTSSITDYDSVMQMLTSFFSVTCGSLIVITVFLFSRYWWKLDYFSSLIPSLVAGFGTLIWKYSSGLYRHHGAGLFLLLSVIMAILAIKKTKLIPLVCFFLGIAIFMEYTLLILVPVIIFFLWFYKRQQKYIFISILIGGIIGFSLPLLSIVFYNKAVTGKYIANPHSYNSYIIHRKKLSDEFQTKLIDGLKILLFSSKPIPATALEYFKDKPEIANQMGSYWATVWPFRGIFTTTPLLWLSVIALALRNNKRWYQGLALIYIPSIVYLLLMSKMTIIWSGNSYDTRYLLPIMPLVLLPGGITINSLLTCRYPNIFNTIIKVLVAILIFILTSISFYWGWFYNITNYAPHVTGEHRFDLDKALSFKYIITNLGEVLYHTFPNYNNLTILPHMLIVSFIVIMAITVLSIVLIKINNLILYRLGKIKI